MNTKIDRREDGWFLNEEKLPGIDVELVKHYRQEGYWPNKTVGDLTEEAATKWPERIALVFGDKRVSYRELNVLSTRLALSFLEIGLKPGDMVAVQLPNILEHVLTFFALEKIGVIVNPISPLMREKEVIHALRLCESKGIIVPYQYHKFNYYNMIQNISSSGSVPSLELSIVVGDTTPKEGGVLQFKTLIEDYPKKDYSSDYLKKYKPSPDDIHLIAFSSGTTSTPKAAIHTHNTELAIVFNCLMADGYTFLRKPCSNIALPMLASGFGRRSNLLSGVMGGVTNIFVDPLTPENILDTFKREKPTHIHGAPALYKLMLDGLLSLEKSETASLEMFHYGGTTMPFEVAKKLRSLSPSLVTVYGLAEIVPICHTSIFDPPEAQIYSSGRPAWGNKVAIVDEKGSRLGAGEEGEIVVKGPGLMLGYLNTPEGNAQAFRGDGFFKTGDLGFFDESCYLHISGRNKDVIDRGGYKFSAREVEELILSHSKVKDAGIVGMPDEKLGERGCAFVVLRENETLQLEELVGYLRDKGLATFKLPERLEIVESLPHTSAGKMEKHTMKEQIRKILLNEKT